MRDSSQASDLGISPLQYLDRLRISRARYLFDHTGMRVNEVATALGFRSPFYFSGVSGAGRG